MNPESARAVFISYASQDADAAQRFSDALRQAGIEVWVDANELRGGEAWDRQIRRQIRTCALFVPLISHNAQARSEGYFRREWRLAVERTQDMADGTPFVLPVVIDDISEATAHVPEPFLAVQWARLPGGIPSPRFIEHVSRLLASAQSDLPEPLAVPAVAPAAAAPRARKWIWPAGLLGLVVLALTGSLLWLRVPPPAVKPHPAETVASAPTSALPERPRIAVLPFENLSPDPNNAFFTDGMHEEIITALANGAPGVDVISRTTMDTYKGKVVTATELARDLHCNYVLEGSLRREGSKVRLALQLIDPRNDNQLWARDFDRKLVSAMAMESEVAAAVASQLSVELHGNRRTRDNDPAAFDLYLKALANIDAASPGSPLATWQASLGQLDQALSRDPTFVRAYVERIGVRISLFLFNYDPDGAGLEDAHRDLSRAQQLAPQDPLVTAAEALLAYAERKYERSLQLFGMAETEGLSDSRMLEWKVTLLFELGRYQEVAALAERLMDLDPKNTRPWYERWFALMELHQPEEAMRAADLGPKESREMLRATVRFNFAGDPQAYERSNKSGAAAPLHSADEIDANLYDVIGALTYLEQYAKGREVIDAAKVESVRMVTWDWPTYRIGRIPVTDQRGWLDLLGADPTAAKADGERILGFLASHAPSRWNGWFREILRADALLFMGDTTAAIASADRAVTLTRTDASTSDQMNAFVWATQIRAWAGAGDAAAARLETLANSVPGLWSGEIVRDPLWAVPLAHNANYLRLRARLQSQMRAVRFAPLATN